MSRSSCRRQGHQPMDWAAKRGDWLRLDSRARRASSCVRPDVVSFQNHARLDSPLGLGDGRHRRFGAARSIGLGEAPELCPSGFDCHRHRTDLGRRPSESAPAEVEKSGWVGRVRRNVWLLGIVFDVDQCDAPRRVGRSRRRSRWREHPSVVRAGCIAPKQSRLRFGLDNQKVRSARLREERIVCRVVVRNRRRCRPVCRASL